MRKIFFTCLILSVFAFGAAEAQKRPTKARETVKIQAEPLSKTTKTVEAPKTVGLTVERYVSNHEVKADGTAVQTIEIRQRFDSEIALARFAGSYLSGVEIPDVATLAGAAALNPVVPRGAMVPYGRGWCPAATMAADPKGLPGEGGVSGPLGFASCRPDAMPGTANENGNGP